MMYLFRKKGLDEYREQEKCKTSTYTGSCNSALGFYITYVNKVGIFI